MYFLMYFKKQIRRKGTQRNDCTGRTSGTVSARYEEYQEGASDAIRRNCYVDQCLRDTPCLCVCKEDRKASILRMGWKQVGYNIICFQEIF